MVEIVVTKRRDDYHASIAGHPEVWDSGKTALSAIGNLVRTHPEKFGIEDFDSTIGSLVKSHPKKFGVKKISMADAEQVKKIIKNSMFGTPVDNIPNTMVGNTNINTDRKF